MDYQAFEVGSSSSKGNSYKLKIKTEKKIEGIVRK